MTLTHHSTFTFFQPQSLIELQHHTDFQQQLAAIEQQHHDLWMIDMGCVEGIDSAGLLTLVNGWSVANQNQCRFVLCNVCPAVKLVLEITQLDQVFEIVDYPAIPEVVHRATATTNGTERLAA